MTTHAGPNTQHVNRSDDEQHDEHLSDASDEDQWDKYNDDLWWGNLGVLLSCPFWRKDPASVALSSCSQSRWSTWATFLYVQSSL